MKINTTLLIIALIFIISILAVFNCTKRVCPDNNTIGERIYTDCNKNAVFSSICADNAAKVTCSEKFFWEK